MGGSTQQPSTTVLMSGSSGIKDNAGTGLAAEGVASVTLTMRDNATFDANKQGGIVVLSSPRCTITLGSHTSFIRNEGAAVMFANVAEAAVVLEDSASFTGNDAPADAAISQTGGSLRLSMQGSAAITDNVADDSCIVAVRGAGRAAITIGDNSTVARNAVGSVSLGVLFATKRSCNTHGPSRCIRMS